MKNINETILVDFYQELLKRTSSNFSEHKKSDCLFIKKIINSDPHIMSVAFGEIGVKIIDFFNNVDLDHIDIDNCFDGLFSDKSSFQKIFDEMYSHASYGIKNNLCITKKLLEDYLEKYIFDEFKSITKIELPENNRCHVRFIVDPLKRDQIRMQKKMQIIDLQSAYKKGIHHYNAHPNNFNQFIRFDNTLEKEVKRLEHKAHRYQEIGCSTLAKDISDNLQIYKEYIDQTYFGFNRITMSSASIILARNFNFKTSLSSNYNSSSSFDISKIYITQSEFEDYYFDQENNDIHNALKTYDYEPKIYPLYAFSEILTDNMKYIIELLDNFPQSNKKPIFDFYGVIVPSINFPYNNSGYYSFIDSKGLVRSYNDCNEAKLQFDKNMIASKNFRPILVAEKDHKCYFISYWI